MLLSWLLLPLGALLVSFVMVRVMRLPVPEADSYANIVSLSLSGAVLLINLIMALKYLNQLRALSVKSKQPVREK